MQYFFSFVETSFVGENGFIRAQILSCVCALDFVLHKAEHIFFRVIGVVFSVFTPRREPILSCGAAATLLLLEFS
jgi:hypothetical protein